MFDTFHDDCSYITGDACGALGGLEGDVLHGEFVALSPQSVPGLFVFELERNDKTNRRSFTSKSADTGMEMSTEYRVVPR